MSTRSAVGIPTKSGLFKGRYVHGSGYPTWVGKKLQELVLRDGYATVVSTIVTGEHYGWSTLNPAVAPGLPDYLESDRFEIVPGYGTAYTNTEAKKSDWVTDKDDWGTEWLYVLGETGIDVFTGVWNEVGKKVGHVRYDDTEGMDRIEKEVYAEA